MSQAKAPFTSASPCPVCGGHKDLPSGRGIRCAGFRRGNYAFCTREEHAGQAPHMRGTQPPSWRHWIGPGDCRCGAIHPGNERSEASPNGAAPPGRRELRRRQWEIRHSNRELFAMHHRIDYTDGGRRIWWEPTGTSAAAAPLYRSETLADIDQTTLVVVSEGEPDTDALTGAGIDAVGTVCGAGGTPPRDALAVLRGHPVALWPDNDDAGRAHMDRVARQLRALGMEDLRLIDWPDAPPKGGARDALEALGAEGVRELVEAAAPYPEGSPASGGAPLPSYPVHVLPEPVLTYVREASAAVGCPPEMVALPLLTNAAAAIGNGRFIELKVGFWQRASLWTAVVAAPGTAKTPAAEVANRPLVALQREAAERFAQAYQLYEAEMAEWEATPRKERGVKPQPPAFEHLLTTDATIESLSGIAAASRGVVLQRDELVGWVTSFDAYRKGGERQAHLSMWAGAPLKVDRKSAPPLFVEHPVVCVAGGVQPDMLAALADEAGRRDGFLERFLWSVPETRPAVWSEAEIPASVRGEMLAVFRALRTSPPPGEPVRLSGEAREVWRDWYDENARLTAMSDGMMAGIAAKLSNQVARLALVLHCIDDPHGRSATMSAETMAAAIELAEYHRAHAHRALSLIADVGALAAPLMVRVRRVLDGAGESGITRSELHRKLGGHTPMAEVVDVLADLENRGLAHCERVEHGERGGRPSERWHSVHAEDNPAYVRTNRQNPVEEGDLPDDSDDRRADDEVSTVLTYVRGHEAGVQSRRAECRCAKPMGAVPQDHGCPPGAVFDYIPGQPGLHCDACCPLLVEVRP